MKRILFAILFLVASVWQTHATPVTISAQTFPNWQAGGATAELRIYSSKSFYASDGSFVPGTRVDSRNAYITITCTVSGTDVSCPAVVVQSTDDGSNFQDAKLTARLYTSAGRPTEIFPLVSAIVPNSQAPTTTWTAIALANASAPTPTPTPGVYTTAQADTLHATITTVANNAQTTADAAQSAIGVNFSQYGNLAAAIAAIPDDGGILNIDDEVGITTDTTTDIKVSIRVVKGGSFNVSSGFDLIINNGAGFSADPLRQVFTGDGAVYWGESVPEKIYPEWFGVETGFAVSEPTRTANTTALQKAVDTTYIYDAVTTSNNSYFAHKSGVIWFQQKTYYEFSGSIDVDSRRFLTFASDGGKRGGGIIRYTGTGTKFFSLRSAQSITFKNLDIVHTKGSFAGNLFHLGRNNTGDALTGELTGDSAYVKWIDCYIGGLGVSEDTGTNGLSSNLINLKQGIIFEILGCTFDYGNNAIVGTDGGYVNVVQIKNNVFVRQANSSILNPGETWNIEDNTKEIFSSTSPFVTLESGKTAMNLTINNTWAGDANVATTFINILGIVYGLRIINNYIVLFTGSKTAVINGSQGVVISGNRGSTSHPIEFTGTNRGVAIFANSVPTGTWWTGTTPSNFFTMNSESSQRFSRQLTIQGTATGVTSQTKLEFSDSANTISGYIGAESSANNDMIVSADAGNSVKIRTNGVSTDRLSVGTTGAVDIGVSLAINGGTALTTTNRTGSGNLVLATSPTLTTPNLGVATATSLNIGSGTPIVKVISGTASLDFTALAANTCEELSVTVTGAANGDVVSIGVPNALASIAGTIFSGYVSATNTVQVRRCNVTTGATSDPASATVRVQVNQF